MAEGAEESGDDMVVGRINQSDKRTRLEAINNENAPGGYAEDFVLDVGISGDKVLVENPNGVDAIHAMGTVEFPTGGMIGVIPAGNGVVGRGLNGLVGYVHPTPRDTSQERDVHAGVLGIGDGGSIGVFGRGVNGVVGYEQSTPRNPVFEATEKAGVLGRGEIGVSGDGANGPGVHGRGLPGVRGEGIGGPGVLAQGQTGVFAEGKDGPGVHGVSSADRGGVFETKVRAQIWLVPSDASIKTPFALLGERG